MQQDQTQSSVQSWIDGHVGHVQLCRPERRNAIAPVLAEDLARTLAEVVPQVRVVVLSGRGPSFCAGADMKERLRGPEHSEQVWRAVRETSRLVSSIEVPVVAAIQGHALGAGLELAANADYRIADTSSTLGIPEVKQGISSGGGLLALATLVPRGTLSRLAFGGELLGAQAALELGIVDEVVSDGTATEHAEALAAEFAEHARPALVAGKAIIRAATQPLGPQHWEMTGFVQRTLEGGESQREALASRDRD